LASVPEISRVIGLLFGAAVVLSTAFDRIALGVHYVSDVVAGWLVAIALVAGSYSLFRASQHGMATRAAPTEH
jgi:membrane-associated phospholipid phosphatase